MSHTIVYQSMSVKFSNGKCFVITQDGSSNCTEYNMRTRREVLERNWRTITLCADKTRNVLLSETELLNSIKSNIQDWSGNDLSSDSCMAYKSRAMYKPYSFWVNHYSNAVKRYSITAETFMQKFKPLSIYIWGANPEKKDNADLRVTVNTADELYNLFLKYPCKQFNFNLRRDLVVSAFTGTSNTGNNKGSRYYVYNLLDNGIYCKEHKRNRYVICCLNRQNGYDCKCLDDKTEQYILNNFRPKCIMTFKSISECVSFFLTTVASNIGI